MLSALLEAWLEKHCEDLMDSEITEVEEVIALIEELGS